jgi:hypothetical protein
MIVVGYVQGIIQVSIMNVGIYLVSCHGCWHLSCQLSRVLACHECWHLSCQLSRVLTSILSVVTSVGIYLVSCHECRHLSYQLS